MYLDKINIMRNENLDIKYGTIPWNASHSSTLIHSKSRRSQTGFSGINPFGWRKRTEVEERARGTWLIMETAGRRDELGFHSEHLRVCVELRNSYPYPATVQS